MYKQFQVTSGPRDNPTTQTVELNGVSPNERLTPKMARRACQVAIGLRYGATVRDDERGYALYPNTARKV